MNKKMTEIDMNDVEAGDEVEGYYVAETPRGTRYLVPLYTPEYYSAFRTVTIVAGLPWGLLTVLCLVYLPVWTAILTIIVGLAITYLSCRVLSVTTCIAATGALTMEVLNEVMKTVTGQEVEAVEELVNEEDSDDTTS